MDTGSADRQLAVQEVTIQVLKRDLEDEKRERERDTEKQNARFTELEKRIRNTEDQIRWGLGAFAVCGAIVASISGPLAKGIAAMVQHAG